MFLLSTEETRVSKAGEGGLVKVKKVLIESQKILLNECFVRMGVAKLITKSTNRGEGDVCYSALWVNGYTSGDGEGERGSYYIIWTRQIKVKHKT